MILTVTLGDNVKTIHIPQRPRAAPTPAAQAEGHQGMTLSSIKILAEILHWNPRCWQALETRLPKESVIEAVEELSGNRIRVGWIDRHAFAHRLLLCLDTCKIIDEA